jgi:Icc-related predicted phosphoesterase
MRVAVTADIHGTPLPPIPMCDMLLVAGDMGFNESFGRGASFSPRAMKDEVRAWLTRLNRNVVVIAGNHDFDTRPFRELHDEGLWTYVEDECVEVEGLKIWGSPWSPTFGQWAFMAPDNALANKYMQIPDDIDIIVSHCPPYGYGDLTQNYGRGRSHVGSKALMDRVKGLPNLKLIACGHIHEEYGTYPVEYTVWEDDHLRRVPVVNGSWVNARYEGGNKPIVVDV